MTNDPVYRQIGIIGSGRAARAFALGLGPYSAARPLLWGRSPDKVRAAIEQISRAAAASRYETLVETCDLIVMAVSDDAIGPVAVDMARAMPDTHVPFVFHVSGRSGAAVLDPLRSKGALTAAIHPVMTFTGDPQNEVERMAGARFAITGSSDDAIHHAKKAVRLLRGIEVDIPEEYRPLYHAALCHAANHLVTLIDGSSQALAAAGVNDPHALLAPLVRAALENSLAHGFAALSGPLLRGDSETISGHLAALEAHSPYVLPCYRAMAIATLDELERGGAAPARQLRGELTGES